MKRAARVALGVTYIGSKGPRGVGPVPLGQACAAKATTRPVRGVPEPGGKMSVACTSGIRHWKCTMLACSCWCHKRNLP